MVMVAALLALPASAWTTFHERRILRLGRPLTPAEHADASAVGVSHPERIRVLAVPSVPNPLAPVFRWIERRSSLCISAPCGLTLRYGIFAVPPGDRSRDLLVHEFTHTRQFEESGGHYGFLRRYLRQCLRDGYRDAPFECEARSATDRLGRPGA